jgi:monooxygenase
VEHVEVLIVGAGLSGVGAGCHLETSRSGTTYAILEARDAIGGTWDLFRYPGIRSDSDMFTLGYRFRPWAGRRSLADGPSILRYVRETARDYGVDHHIRYGHKVVRAEWSSQDACWTVHADTAGGAVAYTCDFLFCCGGYYRYDEGYTPRFLGIDEFAGQVIHPQNWPEDLDYDGKQVVVIGSGATAVTLVPAMAPRAGHVTMLQRSPTYILSIPQEDTLANGLRRLLGRRAGYAVSRAKNVVLQSASYRLCRRRPELAKAVLRRGVRKQLPDGYAVDTHFAPKYAPWDQRLCLVPDGDLFRAISRGQVSVVTDEIDGFTPGGIRLGSGRELPADIVVTATGLNLLALGGIRFVVDGQPVELPDTMAYKGVMLSGVPNFAYIIGYTNASWTLKADLACEYVTRLLRYMNEHGYRTVVPERDPEVSEVPFIDLASGYVRRSLDQLPKQGDRAPWRLRMNYLRDLMMIRHGTIEDDALRFGTAPRTTAAA